MAREHPQCYIFRRGNTEALGHTAAQTGLGGDDALIDHGCQRQPDKGFGYAADFNIGILIRGEILQRAQRGGARAGIDRLRRGKFLGIPD